MEFAALTAHVPEIPLKPGLYVTATPIGNAGDLTVRALQVLKSCDQILCEDTRVTAKLLALYGLKKPLHAYHEHNGARERPRILAAISEGKALALVSDAGMPLISDPGLPLLAAVREAGQVVEVLPGANAALTGLCLSGLATDRFTFLGFLPAKEGGRKQAIRECAQIRGTLIFYESPKRLASSLASLAEILGDREAAVCRELTKKFEEIRRGGLAALAAHYEAAGAPRGEVVLVVEGADEAVGFDAAALDAALLKALAGARLKQAVEEVTALSGLPRKQVYDRALALKNQDLEP